MALKTANEIITGELINGGGPWIMVNLRSTDQPEAIDGGGPFYTPHYVSGGTPPPSYNASQFFMMF